MRFVYVLFAAAPLKQRQYEYTICGPALIEIFEEETNGQHLDIREAVST